MWRKKIITPEQIKQQSIKLKELLEQMDAGEWVTDSDIAEVLIRSRQEISDRLSKICFSFSPEFRKDNVEFNRSIHSNIKGKGKHTTEFTISPKVFGWYLMGSSGERFTKIKEEYLNHIFNRI